VFSLSIPTPSISVVEIGPLTVHAYALCIITGVGVAIWLSNRRFVAAFPQARGVVSDVAIAAVPAGVIGGRLYHVITTPEKYFGSNGNLLNAFKIWEGGLGIWGAIAVGGVGAFAAYLLLARTRSDLPKFRYFADAVAPGIIFAQAIGRWGNWFNAELFGRPTSLPWALEIPQWARPMGYSQYATFHPTFLYESLWCAIIGVLLIHFSGRFQGGQIFTLYVMGYCAGRLVFESIRIDNAHLFAGIRVNIFVAVGVAAISALCFRQFSKVKG
jgi:prolipoprotein diacylglyceryl transferase